MKREIKFRAFQDGQILTSPLGSNYGLQRFFGMLDENSPLMQFTGLKDVNGKEIYEGDIIQFKYYYARKRWWSTTKEIPKIAEEVQKQRDDFNIETVSVEFRDGCFKIGYSLNFEDVARGQRFKTGSSHNGDFEEKQWDFEVIGNIYQNKELLTN